MSTLLWWLIPLGATLIALVWAASRSRPKRVADTHETVGDMARFRAAMRRPLPDDRPSSERRHRPAGPPPSRPGRAKRPADRRHPA